MSQHFSEFANFLWSVVDLLRGDYKQADYGKVILPFTLTPGAAPLRRSS